MNKGPAPMSLKDLEATGNRGKGPLPTDQVTYEAGEIAPTMPLLPVAAEKWAQMVSQLTASNALARLDADMLTIYCATWARYVDFERLRAELEPDDIDNRVICERRLHALVADMRSLANEFGLTPASRTRVTQVDGGATKDEFDDFLQRSKALAAG